MSHPTPDELDDVVLAGRGCAVEDHQRLHRLSPLWVWHADYCHFRDSRVLVEAVLDFNGRYVLAARDNDILYPVRDRDIPVIFDISTVTGPQPAGVDRSCGLVRLVPVAFEDMIGTAP